MPAKPPAKPPGARTGHLFQKKPESGRNVTSERIAEDLKAFQRAGGHVEVLGDTRVLTKIDDGGPAPAAPARETAARAHGPGRRQ